MRTFNLTPIGRNNGILVELFRDMEKAFEGLPGADKDTSLAPRMDVAETTDALEVTTDLPGVTEQDVDVQLHGKVLTIKAEKKQSEDREGKTFHMSERTYGSFSRTLTLPFEADADSVEASLKHGVLHVRVPKPASAKNEVKKITVKGEGVRQ